MKLPFLLFTITMLVADPASAQSGDFWNVDFSKADSIAALYAGRDLKHPERLAEDLARPFSAEAEKFRAIFRWITDNITYDYELYLLDKKKSIKLAYKKERLKKWKQKFSKKSYARTLRQKKAVCFGYAVLLELMAEHVGIPCNIVTGYGRNYDQRIGTGSVNHAWNAAKIEGQWYLCDATWASSAFNESTNKFIRRFNNNYFFTDPSLFIANHFPKDTAWTLLSEKPTLREFLDGPHKTDGFFTNRINHYFPRNGIVRAKQCEPVLFEFTSNHENVRKASLYIIGFRGRDSFGVGLTKDPEGKYQIRHEFAEKGTFEVHIFINSQHTFLYNVVVK